MNYVSASLEELAQHFKNASRQLIHTARERYNGNPDMALKVERAIVMAKIARLQDELGALDEGFEVTKNG